MSNNHRLHECPAHGAGCTMTSKILQPQVGMYQGIISLKCGLAYHTVFTDTWAMAKEELIANWNSLCEKIKED